MGNEFEIQPELTGVALGYTNKSFIADKVFPKVPVTQEAFSYMQYNNADLLTVPNTRIGDTGIPNSIELGGKELTAKVENHALIERISMQKIQNAKNSSRKIDLKSIATMQLTDTLKAGAEVRLSQILSTTSNYGGNAKVLKSDEKINNSNCNAVDLIQDSIDEMFQKANTMVTSRYAMSKLRRNPYIVGACRKNSATSGIVSIEDLKDLFELDNIFVGETIVNTAKKGQKANYAAAWQNDICLMHVNPVANTEYGVTFGYNATLEDITVGTTTDSLPGTKGCEIIKAYESNINLIVCPECGYLLKDVLERK